MLRAGPRDPREADRRSTGPRRSPPGRPGLCLEGPRGNSTGRRRAGRRSGKLAAGHRDRRTRSNRPGRGVVLSRRLPRPARGDRRRRRIGAAGLGRPRRTRPNDGFAAPGGQERVWQRLRHETRPRPRAAPRDPTSRQYWPTSRSRPMRLRETPRPSPSGAPPCGRLATVTIRPLGRGRLFLT